MKKLISIITLLCLVVTLFSGCQKAETDTIKIGSIHPLSGSMAEAGSSLVWAQQIAIDQINENGGINGKKLELVTIDSQGASNTSATAARKLINQGVVALTGAYTSGSSQVVSQEAERGKVPFVVTVAASSDLLSRGYEYSFRIQPSVTVFSKNFITYFNEYIKQNSKDNLKTVALIYENSNYGAGIAGYIKEHIKETGLEIVGDIPYASTAATLSSEVSKLEKLKPDILIPIGYKNDQTILINEILSRNITFKKVIGVANGAFSDPDFLKTYGNRVNGYIDINYRYNSNTQKTDEVLEKYSEKYGKELPVASIYGYESIMVIADAIKRCENMSTDEMRKKIAETSITDHILPQEKIEFDKTGEDKYAASVMIQIQNGEPVVLYPTEYANESAKLIEKEEK